MRILLIMDPGIPVPPPLYGGHERLVHLFAEQYTKIGHEVSLLVGPNSTGPGKVYVFGDNRLNRSKTNILKEIISAWAFLVSNHSKYDLIHNFGRLAYLLPIWGMRVQKIMTYGRKIYTPNINRMNRLPFRNIVFTACSDHCITSANASGAWHTVYNAIDFSKYDLKLQVELDAPLMFLGRLDQVKGAHNAIFAAKKAGQKLLIAGNISETQEGISYYKNTLEPLIDGHQVRYVGPLNDEMKNFYLGRAKALLFPIEWDEPFGLVMIEAMACGTPVIGLNRGSVPEVIQHGKNGFIANNLEEMCKYIDEVSSIDRQQCREVTRIRFNKDVIAARYLSLFPPTTTND